MQDAHHGVPWHSAWCYCTQCKAQWQAAWELTGALRSDAVDTSQDFDIFGDGEPDLYHIFPTHD